MMPDKMIPLSWIQWGRPVVCRLLNPDDAALRQYLVGAHAAREAYPCMLKDPLGQRWYHFDAYLAEIQGRPVFEVTLVPTGEIRVSDASRYAPRPPRQKRRDAGQPRKHKAAPVAT